VTDEDVAAHTVNCLAMDVALSPKLVQWTHDDGRVSPWWPGGLFMPKDEATLKQHIEFVEEQEAGLRMARRNG
jgi:hypothetical protein